MKKFLLLFAIAVLSSCSAKFYETSSVVDFTKYTGDDFIINPTSVSNGEFKPIGTISNYFNIGKAKVGDEDKVTSRTYKMHGNTYTEGLDVSFDYMMNKTIKDAKALGGNGIIEFKMLDVMKGNTKLGYRVEGTVVIFK